MFINKGFELYGFNRFLREKHDISETTIVVYIRAIDDFVNEVDDYYNLEEYNKFLINHSIKKRSTYYYYALKYFIKYKIEDKALKANILENLIKPDIKTTLKYERKYLNEKQILEVINSMKK